MRLTLDFKERLVFASILTDSGKILEMTVREDLTKKIFLTQDEFEKAGHRANGDLHTWDDEKAKKCGTSIELTGAEASYLKDCVKKLEDSNKVNPENLSICKKVIDLKEVVN